jgi:pyruvate ferredoxin oxidoreductase gamma subunit/2-oxoisovalerate ferredoxin oxidoreductase gamma subunit
MVEIRFHSLGGQGAVTLINFLAQAGDLVGKYIQAFPFFGAERRGAPVKSYLRMDDKPIFLRSQIYKPHYLVLFSPALLESALREGTREDTVLLVNTAEEGDLPDLPFEVHVVDATTIALDLGMEVEGMPVVNIAMLGAVAFVTELVTLDAVNEVLRHNVPRARLEASLEAARRGFTSTRKMEKAAGRKKSAAS